MRVSGYGWSLVNRELASITADNNGFYWGSWSRYVVADSTLSLVRRSASTALSRLNPMSVSSRMLASDGATTERRTRLKERDTLRVDHDLQPNFNYSAKLLLSMLEQLLQF